MCTSPAVRLKCYFKMAPKYYSSFLCMDNNVCGITKLASQKIKHRVILYHKSTNAYNLVRLFITQWIILFQRLLDLLFV